VACVVLLDEGISRVAAELLRLDGIDAVQVAEIGLASAAGAAIVDAAVESNRVIFTLDNDYHRLLATSRSQRPSVVLLRFEHLKGEAAYRLIRALLSRYDSELASGVILSVTPGRVRLRRLPL
jgi:predicted nuclease of predicted toxin-antitoxin system